MKYRKLRIAWSVFWGLAGVLMIVLWVRSYRATDVLSSRPFCLSTYGRVVVWLRDESGPFGGTGSKLIYMSSGALLRMSRIKEIEEPFEVEPFTSRTGFFLEHDDGRSVVQLPYWFLTLLFVTFGGLPWLRFRFRLRTLLIGMTLAAVMLAAVIGASQ
jgi:hypothetical protein